MQTSMLVFLMGTVLVAVLGGSSERESCHPLTNGEHYKIIARHSSKVLDVYDGSNDNGAHIIQFDDRETENQLWKFERVSSGVYMIISVKSGKALDVPIQNMDNGVRLIQWTREGGNNQKFRLESVGNGYCRIRAVHSGKVVEVQYASLEDGAAVIQWDSNEEWRSAHQQWRIEEED